MNKKKQNKDTMAETLAEEFGLSKNKVRKLLDRSFEIMSDSLAEGGKVYIYGYGIFELKHRNKRNGFNPATRENFVIEASVTPQFKPSKQLIEKVQSKNKKES